MEQPKARNRPLGDFSPNLVTLVRKQLFDENK
jgi:hypothetical protein